MGSAEIGAKATFAESRLVDRFPLLRDDFIAHVLELPWAFLSDESSLWDFHGETENEKLYLKIGEVYGVDVSDVVGANLAAIFSEIMERIGTFPEDPILRAIRLSRDARDRHIQVLPEYPWNPYAPS